MRKVKIEKQVDAILVEDYTHLSSGVYLLKIVKGGDLAIGRVSTSAGTKIVLVMYIYSSIYPITIDIKSLASYCKVISKLTEEDFNE